MAKTFSDYLNEAKQTGAGKPQSASVRSEGEKKRFTDYLVEQNENLYEKTVNQDKQPKAFSDYLKEATYVTMKDGTEKQVSNINMDAVYQKAYEDAMNRNAVVNAAGGAVVGYAGDMANAGGTLLHTQNAMLDKSRDWLHEHGWMDDELYDRLQREQENRAANANELQDFGDTAAMKGQGMIGAAKTQAENIDNKVLSKAAGIAIDVGVSGIQMAMDGALSTVTGAPGLAIMFARCYGGGTREARLEGADLAHQNAYGIATAGVEVLTEKMFDGVAKIYGAGAADDVTDMIITKLGTTDAGKNALRILIGMAGEGVEEAVSDLAAPFTELLKGTKSWDEVDKWDIAEIGYDFLVGALSGGITTGIATVAGQYKAENAAMAQADVQKACTEYWESLKNKAENGAEIRERASETLTKAKQDQAMIKALRGQLDCTEQDVRGLMEKLDIDEPAILMELQRNGNFENLQSLETAASALKNVIDAQKANAETKNTQEKENAPASGANVEELFNNSIQLEDANTVIDTRETNHTPEIQRGIEKYVKAVDMKILDFINKLRSLENKGKSAALNHEIAKVNKNEIDAIYTMTGIDTTGYVFNINGENLLRHIIEEHGEKGSTDTSLKYDEDIARIGYVLENYDAITEGADYKEGKPETNWRYRNSKGERAPVIIFTKRLDGTYYAVAAVVESKQKKVQIISAYIGDSAEIGTPEFDSGMPIIGPHVDDAEKTLPQSFTPEAAHALPTNRVNQNNETVKGNPGFTQNEAYEKMRNEKRITEKTVRELDMLGKMLGREIILSDDVDANANAYYENGQIVISTNSSDPVTMAAVHEAVHDIKVQDEEAYKNLAEEVFKALANGNELQRALVETAKQYKVLDENGNMTLNDVSNVMEEMVAQGTAMIAQDTNLLGQMAEENRTVLQRIVDAIANLLDKIRGFKDSGEIHEKDMERYDALYENLDNVRNAMMNAINAVNEAQNENAAEAAYEAGEPVAQESEAKLSKKHDPELMEKARTYNEENGGLISEDVMKQAEESRELAKKLLDREDIRDLLPPDVEGATIINNGSYGRTMENGLVCIRSLVLDELQNLVSNVLGRPLTFEESIYVTQESMNHTDKPECAYCYVAADRKMYSDALSNYLTLRNAAMDAAREGESMEWISENVLGIKTSDKKRYNATLRNRIQTWMDYAKNGTEVLSSEDLAGFGNDRGEITQKMESLPESKQAEFKMATDYAQHAARAKLRQSYVAYKGDILKMSQNMVNRLNSMFGLRMYSYTDYSPAYVLENMQMVTDAAAKGLKMLAYTKEVAFARVFAPTGMNISISVHSGKQQMSDGSFVMDSMQGADWEQAKALRAKYPNITVTMVAESDAQVDWALSQDWIDVVIPFHSVFGGGFNAAEIFGWRNFTQFQHDKKIDGLWKKGNKKEIFPSEHQNDVVKYADALIKNNLEPRFGQWCNGFEQYRAGEISADEFRAMNETEDGQPVYMKLVNETRRPAGETPAVQPIFDTSKLEEDFTEFKQRGGYYEHLGGRLSTTKKYASEIAANIESGEAAEAVDQYKNRRWSLKHAEVPTYEQLISEKDIEIVDIRTNTEGKSIKELRAEAIKNLNVDEPILNDETNSFIFVDTNTADHSFGNAGIEQIFAINHIREIVKNARLTFKADEKNANKPVKAVYTFFGAVRSHLGIQPVKLVVKEWDATKVNVLPRNVVNFFNSNVDEYDRLYDSRVLLLDIENENIKIEQGVAAELENLTTVQQLDAPNSTIKISDFLNLVNGKMSKYIPEKTVKESRKHIIEDNRISERDAESTVLQETAEELTKKDPIDEAREEYKKDRKGFLKSIDTSDIDSVRRAVNAIDFKMDPIVEMGPMRIMVGAGKVTVRDALDGHKVLEEKAKTAEDVAQAILKANRMIEEEDTSVSEKIRMRSEAMDSEEPSAADLFGADLNEDGAERIKREQRLEDAGKALDEFWEQRSAPVKQEVKAETDERTNARKAGEKVTLKQKAKDTWDAFKRIMVNQGDSIHQVAKKLNNKSIDGYYFYAMAGKTRAADWVTNKRSNTRGETTGKSLNEIFDPIRAKGDDYYNAFQSYMYHELNVERMSRATEQEERAVKERLEAIHTQAIAMGANFGTMEQSHIANLAQSETELGYLAQDWLDAKAEQRRLEKRGNKPVFGWDTTAEYSRNMADALQREHPEFAELAKGVYEYVNDLTQYQVDAGLISQKQAEQLKNAYAHYVPVFYDMESTGRGVAAGNVNVQSGVKAAYGGQEQILPLHVSLARKTQTIMQNAGINQLGNELLHLRDENKGVMSEYILDVQDAEDSWSPDTVDEDNVWQPNAENEITILEDGKRYTLTLDKGMAAAFQSFKPMNSDLKALNMMKAGNDVFKKLCTAWNPYFLVTNALKDAQDAVFYSTDGTRWSANMPKAYGQIKSSGTYWEMYKSMGGVYGSYFDWMTGETEKSEGKIAKAVGKLESLNMAIEQAPRLAEFMTILQNAEADHGQITMQDQMEAFLGAQEITTNFGRSGSVGKAINRYLVPFWNPGVQGASKVVRTFTETKGFKAWAGLICKAVALGILPEVLNELAYRDDEEWDKISDRNKMNYYLFKGEDGIWYKIPKGRVLAALSAPAVAAMEALRGDEVDFGEIAEGALDNVAPNNPLQTNLFSAAISADLFDKDSTGKTWYGSNIESQRLQNYDVSKRYDESTDAISKWLGEKLDLSPKKINYIIDQYSGVLGDILLPMLTPKAERGLFDIAGHQVGTIGASKFTLDTVTSNTISGEYYQLSDELKFAKNEDDLGAAAASSYMTKRYNDDISGIYKKIREIENDTELTDAEKTTLTRELRKTLNETMEDIIEKTGEYRKTADAFLGEHEDFDYNDEKTVKAWAEQYNAEQSTEDYFITDEQAAGKMREIVKRESNKEMFGAEYALQAYDDDVYEKAQKVHDESGISYELYYDYYFGVQNLHSDKDDSGKSISGSKKEKVVEYINSLDATPEEKDALYIAAGYTKGTLRSTPWNGGSGKYTSGGGGGKKSSAKVKKLNLPSYGKSKTGNSIPAPSFKGYDSSAAYKELQRVLDEYGGDPMAALLATIGKDRGTSEIDWKL